MNPWKELTTKTITFGQESLTVITQPVTPMTMPRSAPDQPEGWLPAAPDFVGMGTARSGTTWWWTLLTQHSRYADRNARKELHFFDHYMGVEDIDPAAYHRYFPRPPGMVAGEWTPRYMYDYWTPPMLRRVAPDTKLLVLLRDPVQRLLSNLALIRSRGIALSHSQMHLQYERSLYGQQVHTLYQHFPEEQVLVLQYEQCVRDPVAQMHRTLEFLGLDPAQWHPRQSPTTRVNESTGAKPDLDPDTVDALALAFQADLSTLFDLVPALDESLWPTAGYRARGRRVRPVPVPGASR